MTLRAGQTHLEGTLTIYYGDLPLIIDGLPFHVPDLTDLDWPQHEQRIIGFLDQHLRFLSGERDLSIETRFGPITHIDEDSNVIIPVSIDIRLDQMAALSIHQTGFYDQNPQYTSLVTLDTGTQQKTVVLNRSDHEVDLFIDPSAEALAFLRHGLQHILEGIDHVFFILLLIFSPFLAGSIESGSHWRKPGWELIKLATAFTVAHSITLAMAVMKIFFLPSALVEWLIMFSIVFVGLHNLLRLNIKREWLIVFAFGLFHGYGFSGALQNLGLSRGHLALPLASFNVGVELGQILVILLVFPALYLLTQRWENTIKYIRYATIGITVTASWWLLKMML